MPVRISYEYFVIAPLAEALPGEEPCTIIIIVHLLPGEMYFQ